MLTAAYVNQSLKNWDKIHAMYVRKFCRPTSGAGVINYSLDQSCSSASIERVSVYIRNV